LPFTHVNGPPPGDFTATVFVVAFFAALFLRLLLPLPLSDLFIFLLLLGALLLAPLPLSDLFIFALLLLAALLLLGALLLAPLSMSEDSRFS